MKLNANHYIFAKSFNALMTSDINDLFEKNFYSQTHNYPIFFPQTLLRRMFDKTASDESLSIGDIFSELSSEPLSYSFDKIRNTKHKTEAVMFMLSELVVNYDKLLYNTELYIADLFFQFRVDVFFSFLKMISGTDYDDAIDKILTFTENANELMTGPYTDISDLRIGEVILKANYAYKMNAFAKDIFFDEEEQENFASLRNDATDIMATLLLIPYEVCYRNYSCGFKSMLIENNSEFIAAITNNN